MCNNESASDEELHAEFVAAGLTHEQATQALTYRDVYQQNMFLEGHTPIVKSDEALRFDPHRSDFVRWQR